MRTTATYSITTVHNQFTSLEDKRLIEHQPQTNSWQAYMNWRNRWNVDEWEDSGDDPFADVRDKSPGREINLWL